MHDSAGGLATSWRRGDYTFETCLHWLLGTNPNRSMYSRWLEVFDIDKLTFLYSDEFVRLETEHGECLRIYSNVDRLETEMLRQAPQDAGKSAISRRPFEASPSSNCPTRPRAGLATG